jgi:preprotein translocase subunit YajC
MPQRREKKRRAQMLDALKKGDRIQTIGGILGTVVEVREQEVVIKVDENNNTKLHFARAAIQTILPEGKTAQ